MSTVTTAATKLHKKAMEYLETLRERRAMEALKFHSDSFKKIRLILSYLLEEFYEDIKVEIRPASFVTTEEEVLKASTFVVNIRLKNKTANYFFTFYPYPSGCSETFQIKEKNFNFFSKQYIYGNISGGDTEGSSIKLDNGLEDKFLFVIKLLKKLNVTKIKV